MSIVFVVLARNEPIVADKVLHYLGAIEEYSSQQFEAQLSYTELELDEGHGMVFMVNDERHTNPDLHIVLYDAVESEMFSYHHWMRKVLGVVFGMFVILDSKQVTHYIMGHNTIEGRMAIVYKTPFNKKYFLDLWAKNKRRKFHVIGA